MSILGGPRVDRLETMREARDWDNTKSHYLQLGLCHTCAPQAAYGHQVGFARVLAPCTDCVVVVAEFPVAAPNGWRKMPQKQRRAVLSGSLAPAPAAADALGATGLRNGAEVAA